MRQFCTVEKIFTGLCTIITVYLVVEVVLRYAVSKPTSSSEERVPFDLETFPDVIICIDPAIDKKASSRYGYEDPVFYWFGQNDGWDGTFIGWNGKKPGYSNSTEILEDLLNFKMGDTLVDTAFYLRDGIYESSNRSLVAEFVMLLFPFGRCQLVKPPKIQNILGVSLVLNTSTISKLTTELGKYSLNFLLMDPVNSPLVHPENFQMKGSQIKVQLETSEKSWHPFQIKVSQSHHLQDDPHFECKEYDLDNSYGKCVREELKRRFVQILNCTPPILATSSTCNKRFDLRGKEGQRIQKLFSTQDIDSWT